MNRTRQRKITRDMRRIGDAVRAEVRNERLRQISHEGFHPDDDDEMGDGELARAACAYIRCSSAPADAADLWPWPAQQFKPKSRRRNLIVAAALILAELERLERARERAEAIEPPLPLGRPHGS
jgi:hypothetical protein